MRLLIDRHWRIDARGEVELPLPASTVWGQMRDITRFLATDPLHARVRLGPPRRPDTSQSPRGTPLGASLVLAHRFLGVGPDRVGRVLRWEEGRGYAVSDLSRRGPRVGFPHICTYEVLPLGPSRCRILVGARGRWTARWVPRPLVRAWLWWVLRSTEARIEAAMLHHGAWLRRAR